MLCTQGEAPDEANGKHASAMVVESSYLLVGMVLGHVAECISGCPRHGTLSVPALTWL